jgi:hypothetical protein
MEAARTSETSVDNYFTRPIPDDGGSTYIWNVGPQLFYTAHPWWWTQHESLKRRSIILHGPSLMMEAARTSETSVDYYFTRPIPDDGGSTNLWNIVRQLFYTAHPWWWRQHEPLKRRSTIILHGTSLMMEAARTSETSVENYFTRPIPDDGGSTYLWNVGRLLFYTAHPWWWRQHEPLKRRSTIILHGSTSQKTILNYKDVIK